MSAPTAKQQARIERSILAWPETHGLSGEQTRGPVWRGPLPTTPTGGTNYTPAFDRANRKIDEKNATLGITPMSGLAQTLARLNRRDRRSLLAIVQRKAGVRRSREEKVLTRRLASQGITL